MLARPSLFVALLSLAACSPARTNADAAEDAVADSAREDDASIVTDVAVIDASSCAPLPTPLAFVRNAAVAHSMDDTLRMNHLQAKAMVPGEEAR